MDVRSYVVIENKKDDRLYQFFIPVGAPYEEAEQVAKEFAGGVVEMQAMAKKQAEASQEPKAPQEAEVELVGN
jgi:hypothetical protein